MVFIIIIGYYEHSFLVLKVIKFPQSQADVERTQAAFQAIAGFPRVVG